MHAARASVVLATLLAASWPAAAAEFSLTGNVAQRFSAITNPDASPDSDGPAIGSISTIGLNFAGEKGRTRANISTRASFSAFAGGGADDDLNLASPNAQGRLRYSGKRFSAATNFGFSRTSTTFSDLNTDAILEAIAEQIDDGPIVIPSDELIVEEDAIRTTYSLGADLGYTLSLRNQLTLAGSGRVTRFNEDTDSLDPSSNYGASLSWDHSLSPISGAGLSVGVRRFSSDNTQQTDGLTFSLSTNYRTQLTRSTNINLSGGVTLTDIDELEFVNGIGIPTTDRDVSFAGSFGATYRSDRDTLFNFGVTQSVVPTDDGDLRNITGIRLSYRQSLTRLVGLTVGAGHSIATELTSSGGEDDDLEQVFTFSPTLNYRFAPRWSANLGYSLRVEDDEAGIGVSNRVFLSVSRQFDLF